MTSAAKTSKMLATGVALMVIGGLGPWMVLGLLGWSDVANAAILPAIAVTVACVTGAGWRSGILIIGPFAVLAGLAVWASPEPLFAAIVLAIAAFLRGYAAKEGMHGALTLTVITLGFLVAVPPTFEVSMSSPLVVGLVTLAAGLWSILVIFAVGKWLPRVPRVHLNSIRVLVFSFALALLVGIATFLVVRLDLGQTGGWIILTVVVVFQPYLGAGFTKAAHRALGTVAGFGITIVIGLFFPAGPILYVFGAAFIIVAFLFILQSRPYWLYAMVLTPAVVLLDSAGSDVGMLAVERLEATIVGIALTLLVMLALSPLAHRLESKPVTTHKE